jgi:hypothetical protein
MCTGRTVCKNGADETILQSRVFSNRPLSALPDRFSFRCRALSAGLVRHATSPAVKARFSQFIFGIWLMTIKNHPLSFRLFFNPRRFLAKARWLFPFLRCCRMRERLGNEALNSRPLAMICQLWHRQE